MTPRDHRHQSWRQAGETKTQGGEKRMFWRPGPNRPKSRSKWGQNHRQTRKNPFKTAQINHKNQQKRREFSPQAQSRRASAKIKTTIIQQFTPSPSQKTCFHVKHSSPKIATKKITPQNAKRRPETDRRLMSSPIARARPDQSASPFQAVMRSSASEGSRST